MSDGIVDVLIRIKSITGLPDRRIAQLLGVSRQALHAWRRGGLITDAHRQRVLIVLDILERAIVRRPTREQMQVWLDMPSMADGRTPAQELADGRFDYARYRAMSSYSWEGWQA